MLNLWRYLAIEKLTILTTLSEKQISRQNLKSYLLHFFLISSLHYVQNKNTENQCFMKTLMISKVFMERLASSVECKMHPFP